ncbi:MAG: ABC transporter ATP-binding protein [Solitalea-like symbiont of Tyrophagus putrescentiae]
MNTLIKYLYSYKYLILTTLFLAAINQVFSMLNQYVFGNFIIDRYINKIKYFQDNNLTNSFVFGIIQALMIIVLFAMISRIAKTIQNYAVSAIVQKVGTKMYTDGLKKTLLMPYSYLINQSSGETLNILQKVRIDCEKIITNFINVVFVLIIAIIVSIALSIHISFIIPMLYITGSVAVGFLTKYLSYKVRKIQSRILKDTNVLAGSTTESLHNIELIKSLGLTNQAIDRLNDTSTQLLKLELKKIKNIRSLNFLQGTFLNFFQQVILFMLAMLAFQGKMTIGQLMMLHFFSAYIFNTSQELGNVILSYREAQASLKNFNLLMQRPVEITNKNNQVQLDKIKSIEFKNVCFNYGKGKLHMLNNISFEINNNETIAFVGPSGSGKSTLIKLIVGLYKPLSGTILYNGIDYDQIDLEFFRKKIGFVTQNIHLFSGTIRNNLKFVNPDATDAEILKAINMSSADMIFDRSKEGLDTIIGEGGIKLSGGERQRISIARALVRHPGLLIFDEATSALDSLTETNITSTIKTLAKDKKYMVIIIAHRLSTISHSDKIFVLDKGQIVDVGSHDSLLQKKGLYYDMWKQQT